MAFQTITRQRAKQKGSLETFAAKLVDKVINANSPTAIERYISVAVKALDNNKINGYIIQRFIDRASRYLDTYPTLTSDQQLNSETARIHLQKFRSALGPSDKR